MEGKTTVKPPKKRQPKERKKQKKNVAGAVANRKIDLLRGTKPKVGYSSGPT